MLSKVYVEITNVCNLACSFCPKTERAPRFMTPGEFAHIADKLDGKTKYVYLHVMGEPLLSPHLEAILGICEVHGFKTIITTNGTLLASPNADAVLASSAIYKVSASLHSFEANSGSASLEDYLGTVVSFMKKAAGRGIISVMRLWNLDGDLTHGENSLNGEIISFLKGEYPDEWVNTRSGQRVSDKTYIEWGEKFDWPDPEADYRGTDGYCYGVHDQIGILADGTVVPCCLDHNGDVKLGNIFDSSLGEILSSDRAVGMAEGFKNRRMVEELCRRCGFARQF